MTAPAPMHENGVAQILQQLAVLEKKDPAAFDAIMMAMEKETMARLSHEAGCQGEPDTLKDLKSTLLNFKKTERVGPNIQLPGEGGVLGEKGVEQKEEGIFVKPIPGFVLKTFLASTEKVDQGDKKDKVFINICRSERIGEPAPKTRLNDEGEEIEGINVPMSVGPERMTKDKNGRDCTSCDVIVNPKVLQECEADKTGTYRDFVCQLCLQYVEQKYGKQLSRKYKLPKLKYQGEVQGQMVRDISKAPKIEEVRENSFSKASSIKGTNKKNCTEASKEAPAQNKPVTATLYLLRAGESVIEEASNPLNPDEIVEPQLAVDPTVHTMALVLKFSEDKARISEGCVQVSEFLVSTTLPGYESKEFLLPFPIRLEQVSACIHVADEELRIFLPVNQKPPSGSADPGSKPWLLAEALKESSNDGVENENSEKPQEARGRPADHFHLKTSEHISTNSVTNEIIDDTTELEEDKFHRADYLSQHFIQEREKNRREKADRWKKEREGKSNNPNVEYIDMEDFKTGAKYGAPVNGLTQPQSQNLREKTSKGKEDPVDSDSKDISSALQDALETFHGLFKDISNDAWTQLLD